MGRFILTGQVFFSYNITTKNQSGEKSNRLSLKVVFLLAMLFKIYMSKLHLTLKDVNSTPSADDMTSTTSDPYVEKLGDVITSYLTLLHDWLASASSRKLRISAEKSSATVFTTWSKEAKFDPHLTIIISTTTVMYIVKFLFSLLIVCSF